jgi:WhiB family redox-sensing transcriptional regulator
MADFSRLPGPNADLWDWQLRGLCRGKDSSLFFHPEGERGAARSSRESAAKEICLNCPVQIPCADHALKVREPYGVWGGMTEDEREEHHARQKALARAQAARETAARLSQEKLKEKLLREKAASAAPLRPAAAAVTANAVGSNAVGSNAVGSNAAGANTANANGTKPKRAAAPIPATAPEHHVAGKKAVARKRSKPLVKA